MKRFELTTSSNLALQASSYIYKLAVASSDAPSKLAAICSDDSLRIFDGQSLKIVPGESYQKVHTSVTCLEAVGGVGVSGQLVTAGRDGFIRWWDARSHSQVLELSSPKKEPISCLAVGSMGHLIVSGTELEKDGPGDAPMFIWDTRNPGVPLLHLPDSHNDTVTELRFHPNLANILLTGSTDGLVNVFDIQQSDEEDALYQTINHYSAVHHAGFLDDHDVFVLGTDEKLSFHRLQDPNPDAVEPAPIHLGDVREKLNCDYVIGVVAPGSEGEPVLAAGNQTLQHLDLVSLRKPDASTPLHWSIGETARLQLPPEGGSEVVRDFYLSVPNASRVWTCGEDGHVRAWKLEGIEDSAQMETKSPVRGRPERESPHKERREKKSGHHHRKHKHNHGSNEKSKRYKPY